MVQLIPEIHKTTAHLIIMIQQSNKSFTKHKQSNLIGTLFNRALLTVGIVSDCIRGNLILRV